MYIRIIHDSSVCIYTVRSCARYLGKAQQCFDATHTSNKTRSPCFVHQGLNWDVFGTDTSFKCACPFERVFKGGKSDARIPCCVFWVSNSRTTMDHGFGHPGGYDLASWSWGTETYWTVVNAWPTILQFFKLTPMMYSVKRSTCPWKNKEL